MLKYKKKFGQNFLIDNNIKKNILNILKIKMTETILEIGAGSGSLTKEFILLPKFTYLLEIDKNLSLILEKKFINIKKKKILTEDILKLNFRDILKKKKIRIIGCIPYNISSKILLILSRKSANIKDIHLIVQKEFAEKIISNRQKNLCNGYVSFLANYKFYITKIFNINRQAFFPAPKVHSVFLSLKPRNKILILNNHFVKQHIKILFKNRRKKIKNTIPLLKKLHKYISSSTRADKITITEYIRILNLLYISKFD